MTYKSQRSIVHHYFQFAQPEIAQNSLNFVQSHFILCFISLRLALNIYANVLQLYQCIYII